MAVQPAARQRAADEKATALHDRDRSGGARTPASERPSAEGADVDGFYAHVARMSLEGQLREKRPLTAPGEFLDRLFREIESAGGHELGTVLDFGGDTGVTLSLMASRLSIRRPVCYDLVAPAEPLPAIEYVQGSWEELARTVPEGSVDVVLAEEVIEHIFDPDTLIERFRRLLAPRGLLVITTPNLSSAVNRIGLLLGRQPGGTEVSTRAMFSGKGVVPGPVAGHIRVFTFGALLDFLRFHGFTVLKGYTMAWPPRSGLGETPAVTSRRDANLLIERVAARLGRGLGSRSVAIARAAPSP